MIDAATLTGACIVALGHEAAAVVSNSDDVCAELQSANKAGGDRVWRLPEWGDYDVFMDGNDADICNMSNGPPVQQVLSQRVASSSVLWVIPLGRMSILPAPRGACLTCPTSIPSWPPDTVCVFSHTG